MPLETITGPEFGPLFTLAQQKFGPDTIMVQTREFRRPDGTTEFEVLVGDTEGAERWQRLHLTRDNAPELTAMTPLPSLSIPQRKKPSHPFTIALVGPTGAGKTTTIAKLMGHPRIFAPCSVALLSLDTYRVGAVEQLRTYADIAHVPLEVVYETDDIERARRRCGQADIVLIDTPGRGPRARSDRYMLQQWLRRIAPDEIHVTLPAGLNRELASQTVAYYRDRGATHVLATKLDEMPTDWILFELAAELHMPMRWVTHGQEVPADIRSANPRLLAAIASQRRRAREQLGGVA